jgi:lysophospholipid acyltransferase (LPLAT)-like uncharacterized protein
MSVWEKLRWKILGILGRFILRVWGISSRIKVLGEDEYRKAKQTGKPIILILWHGRIMLVPHFFRKRGLIALVSPSREGEILTQIGLGWGYRVIRGSSSHSIVRAWVALRQELGKGGEVILTPDGPRGPGRSLKPGCLKLAQDTGAVIIPWSFSASRKKFLKSWDRFLLFYPFSRVVSIYGKPITVSPALDDAEFESERKRVEETLQALDAEADSHFF